MAVTVQTVTGILTVIGTGGLTPQNPGGKHEERLDEMEERINRYSNKAEGQ